MKKLIAILLLVGIMPVVQGSQDVIELGPYNISFDLGDLNYTIEFEEPYNSETYGGINYTSYEIFLHPIDGGLISIDIAQYQEKVGITFENAYKGTEPYVRTIDTKTSVLFFDEELGCFIAEYTLESQGWVNPKGNFTGDRVNDKDAEMNGYNLITIRSVANWEATRKLLNTIHVELRDEP